MNIAHEAVDRHAAGPRADRVALRWIGKTGSQRDFTYRDLAARPTASPMRSRASASAKATSVFVLLGRVPELYVAVLGALEGEMRRLAAVFRLRPRADRHAADIGDGQVLVTTEALYRRKVEALRAALPKLAHVILVDEGDAGADLRPAR